MSNTYSMELSARLGDHVLLRGTRIAGDVVRVEGDGDRARLSIRVTEVLGKSPKSKVARAWRGARLTCAPVMVVMLQGAGA